MKIKHKYIRNRLFRQKNWNRIKKMSNPYETILSWWMVDSVEAQVNRHFKWIDIVSRVLDKGTHKKVFINNNRYTNRSMFVKNKNQKNKIAMQKINNGQYELEIVNHKHYIDWF